MRLYGDKVLRRHMERTAARRVETRDAVVWEVIPSQRLARVKIQGSAQLIVCRYPLNWESTPPWLKKGNAVRIVHVGGVRGRLELAGHGATLPTPLAGDTALVPDASPDAVISGLGLVLTAGMVLGVTVGQLRMDDVTSTVLPMTMAETNPLPADTAVLLDTLAAAFTVPAAPAAGTARIDLVCIGADQAIDYVSGTAAADPAEPDLPADHLRLGTVLVLPGTTALTAANLNAGYIPLRPTRLTLAIADTDLAWGESSTTCTVTVRDQYGNALAPTGIWRLTLAIVNGNGTVSVGSSSGSSATGATAAATLAFTYTRGGADPGDLSPALSVTLDGTSLSAVGTIILRDASGAPM